MSDRIVSELKIMSHTVMEWLGNPHLVARKVSQVNMSTKYVWVSLGHEQRPSGMTNRKCISLLSLAKGYILNTGGQYKYDTITKFHARSCVLLNRMIIAVIR